jgi:plastocyanin
MRRRIALGTAWLAACALVAPGVPIADEPAGTTPADPVQPAPATEPPADSLPTAAPPPPAGPERDAAVEASPAPSSAQQATPDVTAPPAAGASAPPEPTPADEPDRPIAVAAAPGSVTIEDFSFGPADVTVGVGETVTWRNDGPSAHTATANDGSFDTGLLDRGESGSATFDRAGTFSYLCEPHPFMKGTVRVVADASSGSGSTGGGAGDDTGSSAGTTTGAEPATAGDSGLPSTGAEPAWLALTGIGLLLIGCSGRRLARSRS